MGEFSPVYLAITRGIILGFSVCFDQGYVGIYVGILWVRLSIEFRRRNQKSTKFFEFVNEWNHANGRS